MHALPFDDSHLYDDMRKVQDTVPTHTAILGQKLACLAMVADDAHTVRTGGTSWVQTKVDALRQHRDALHAVLKPYGVRCPLGAFYFLLKVGISTEVLQCHTCPE